MNSKKNIKSLSEQDKKSISDILLKLSIDFQGDFVIPKIIQELNKYLKDLKSKKITTSYVNDLITDEHLNLFRKTLFLQDKGVKSIMLKVLRNNIEIYPQFTNKLLHKMFPIVICKILEDFRRNEFEEKYECLKLIYIWLKFSDNNFPLIFCQGIASMSKTDELFKKGCIEFLRTLSIIRPDLCSTVGGFRILINSLLDEYCFDISDNIFYTLLYIINSPNKRKYFNGFEDLYKIFSIFTQSDFSVDKKFLKGKDPSKQNETIIKEKKRTENQLQLSKRIILKLLKTWPGFSLIMGDYMAIGSIVDSLNTDTDESIKTTALNMFKDILDEEYNFIDDFTTISSPSLDYLYINKIFLAYILQGLQVKNFYGSLIKVIEHENSTISEAAHQLALKYVILYSKLSNTDLQLPFLNETMEKQKNSEGNKIKEIDTEVVNMKVKIMHLLEQTFYRFNRKDFSSLDIDSLSTEVITALHSIINLKTTKKYDNQCSIESCQKELYSIDKEYLEHLIKMSKIETKEPWDWGNIDSILDIIENKKELIIELNGRKFFRKLLFFYAPSKNLFVRQLWIEDSFLSGSVGNKLFKLIGSCDECENILKLTIEDVYISIKKFTWLEDVKQCLTNLILKTKKEDKINPFVISEIYTKMSRNIFSFLGILSKTQYGEIYLQKEGFYRFLIEKLVPQTSEFDYLLTTIIDNINFASEGAMKWLETLIEKGPLKIKRYIFDHMRCLIHFDEDISFKYDLLIKSINKEDPESNKIIISILKSLVFKGINDFEFYQQIIQNENVLDKKLLYVMMRNNETNDIMMEFIDKEIKEINVEKIVEAYGDELEDSMSNNFNSDDTKNNDDHFLTINLSQIENQYEQMTEFFWLKQLPFHVLIDIIDNNDIKEEHGLISYMENIANEKIILYCRPKYPTKIIVEPRNNEIKFLCRLGNINIDRTTKSIGNTRNFLTFTSNDLVKKTSIPNKPTMFLVQKEGVNIILEEDKIKQGNFSIYSINFSIKIIPEIKKYLKTPINILTELPNTKEGYEKLKNIGAIEKLLSYLDVNKIDTDTKNIKSALWILAKVLIKDNQNVDIEKDYQIIQKILKFNQECNDYGMKGTIIYVLCYLSQNMRLKPILEKNNFSYFFNTDICYPNNLSDVFMNNKTSYENEKLIKDERILNEKVKLSSQSEEIYNNITSLLNNISYKSAYQELEETNKECFDDPDLFVKVYGALSRFKFKQSLRRYIMVAFENAISSQDIIDKVGNKLKDIKPDLFLAGEIDK